MVRYIFLVSLLFIPIVDGVDNFYVYTPPKTGTHLLFKALELMTNRQASVFGSYKEYTNGIPFEDYIESHPHRICHTHTLPDPSVLGRLQERGIKTVSIIRDPRDQLISLIYFEHKTGNYREEQLIGFPDKNTPLKMQDASYVLNLILLYDLWPYKGHHNLIYNQQPIPYLKGSLFLAVKFEDLVGEKGGGSKERQTKALLELADFLNIENPDIEYVSENLFGNTWSFRNGKIGTWRNYFYPKHKQEFKKRYEYIMQNLGYVDW